MKKIAIYYLQNKRSIAKGCLYLSKLLQSKATTREDKIFALPYLIQYHVDEAAQLIAASDHDSSTTNIRVNKHEYSNTYSNIEKNVIGEVPHMTWKRQGAKSSLKKTKITKNEKETLIINATGTKSKSTTGKTDQNEKGNRGDATSVM